MDVSIRGDFWDNLIYPDTIINSSMTEEDGMTDESEEREKTEKTEGSEETEKTEESEEPENFDEQIEEGKEIEQDEQSEERDIEQIIEAVLYSAGRPLTVPEIEESIGKDRKEVRQAVKKLKRMYQNRKSALEIKKIGRKYSLQLKPDYNRYGLEMMDEDIPKPILKTAALVAYYQPVKQSELKKMVGNQIYEHVEKLQEMDLILVEEEGRTYSLRTAPKFQEYFGLEAKDRNELKKIMAKKAGLDRERL